MTGFVVEQPQFGRRAPATRIGTELVTGREHAVTGDDDGEGIARAGLADRARTGIEYAGKRAVAQHVAKADAGDAGAQCFAPRTGGGRQRKIEIAQDSREIGEDLRFGFTEDGCGAGTFGIAVIGFDRGVCECIAIGHQSDHADGRCDQGMVGRISH